MNPPAVISLSSDLPLGVMLLLLMGMLAFSVWSYRRTTPPVSRWIRICLMLLRFGALTGALMILTRPVWELRSIYQNPAEVLMLVDRSTSMSLVSGDQNRLGQLKDILSSGWLSDLGRRYALRWFGFSDSLGSPAVSPHEIEAQSPVGVGTNLARAWTEALAKLGPELPTAAIIISDGAHNDGPDPARLAHSLRIPVWSIGIGSPKPSRDLMLLVVNVNPVVYRGSRVPVEVAYRAVGVPGQSAELSIIGSDGKAAAQKQVVFKSDFDEGTVTFDLEVSSAGRLRFTARISSISEELTQDNNQRNFFINVLPDRMKLLILSGPPDNDLGDLVRRLSRDEHLELILRTVKGKGFFEGNWPDETVVSQLDACILHHFPSRGVDKTSLSSFVSLIAKANLPVGFIDGGETDYRLLSLFDSQLPVTVAPKPGAPLSARALPLRRHAIIADPEQTDFARGWSSLPPLEFIPNAFQLKPQALVLAEFEPPQVGAKFPALVISESAGSKSAALLGRDLWRWGLVSPGPDGILEPLYIRLIRWLALRKVMKPVNIEFDKELFSTQESVGFSISVYDENYRPVENAEVRCDVTGDGKPGGEVAVENRGQGQYHGSFHSWGEGEYTVRAQAAIGGTKLGEDQAKAVVELFSIELLDSRMNLELLKAISEASGGVFFTADSAASLLPVFDYPPSVKENIRHIDLWGRGWLLLAIIILLATEWTIRMRTGML